MTAFIATSITLTVLASRAADQGSVADQIGTTAPTTPEAPATGGNLPTGTDLLPPPAADAPAAPPAAENRPLPFDATTKPTAKSCGPVAPWSFLGYRSTPVVLRFPRAESRF